MHDFPRSSHRARRGSGVAACLLLLASGLPQAGAQSVLKAQLIVSGGGRLVSAGGCLGARTSFGETAAGRSSGGSFVLTAGFQAGPGRLARDAIFTTGFEGCN
ncbi:MAG: hypothetical protein AMXMBFR59_36170 [Rhodanobacteraceae bacterium]